MILGRSKRNPPKEQAEPQAKAAEPPQPAPDQNAGDGDKGANGAMPASGISPRAARQIRMAQSFSQVIAVMMRDPNFRKLPLSDLEWLVLPPLMAGQFRLAHLPDPQSGSEKTAMVAPVAVALWARVSPAIDKALSETLEEPARLPTDKWASGDKLWLMAVAGDPRALPSFLKQLQAKEFEGQEVKLRRRGPDGKVMVTTLEALASAN
jgi:cytolysin-activating lysine-acyltransferase